MQKEVLYYHYALFGAVIFLVVLLLLLPYHDINTAITANAVRDSFITAGGNVTAVNLIMPMYWRGYYGNLSQNVSLPTTILVDGENESEINVFHQDLNLLPCNNTEIYATNVSVPSLPNSTFMNGINSAIKEALDEYLGLLASDTRSGSQIFKNLSRFEVGDDELLMYSAQMFPLQGNYWEGLLETRRRDFVFVSNITVNRTIFTDNQADYEIMLPVPFGQNITYYFFQDITDNCDFPARNETSKTATSNVTIIILQGGGSSEKEPRCGNEVCERLENCKTCDIDCGVCPTVDVTKVVYQDKYIYVNNLTEAENQLTLSKQVVIDNPECTELKPLLQKAEEMLKQNNYAEAIVLLKQVIDMCKDLISKIKPLEYNLQIPSISTQDQEIVIKTLLGIAIGIIVGLLSVLIYKDHKIKQLAKRSVTHQEREVKNLLKKWR